MMNSTTSPKLIDENLALRKTNAIRISIMLSIALFTGTLTLYLYTVFQDKAWQFYVLAAATAIAGIGNLIALRLSQRNKINIAVAVMFVGIGLNLPTAIALFSGIGLVLGTISIIGMFMIANLTLVQPQFNRALIFAVVLGVGIILLDLFIPVNRLELRALQIFTPIVAVPMIGIFAYYISREFSSYPLRGKLTTAFVALTLAIAVLIGYQSITITRSNLTDQAFTDITETAKSGAQSIDLVLNNQLDAIRTESQIIDLVDYLSLPVNQRAGSVQESRTFNILTALTRKDPVYISSYALLDSKGTDVVDTFQADIGVNKSDRDYFINPFKSGVPYISPVRISQTTYESSIYFSSPVRNSDGTIIGVLRVRYNATFLQSLLNDSTDTQHAEEYAVLVDNETFVSIAHTGDPSLVAKTYKSLNAEEVSALQTNLRLPPGTPEELVVGRPEIIAGLGNLNEQPIFSAPSIYDNAPAYSGGYKVENADWTVMVQRTERSALAPIRSQTRAITVLALFITGLAAAAGLYASQLLTQPLVQLSNVATDIANGNLNARAQVQNKDEIGALATSFNLMTSQLQETLNGLEQRVADRTKALETATEVSRRLSTILDQNKLVAEVVEQVKSAYNYYHGQIYLLDASGQTLVLAGATGEGGKAMLENKHTVSIEKGLVGRAARSKASVLVPDTSQDSGWLPNPLLPDTKAEVAVPILLGDELLGVIDMQDDVVGDIFPEDVDFLSAIANQVAIGLQNARSYTDVQARAEREALISSISQKIQETTTVENALQVALRELGHATGTQTSVRLKQATTYKEPKTTVYRKE